MNLAAEAKALSDQIITWRRDLHRIPEIGRNLPQTAAYVQARLTELGIPYQTYEGHSGMTALIGWKTGRVVALRADMDGLEVREENTCDYRSTNNNMHACGHDAHTACLLAAAKILKSHEDELNGQVKLLFQADEEDLSGAQAMVDSGALKTPDVDAVYCMHVGGISGVKNAGDGDIIVSRGASFAASGLYDVTIYGHGGHASRPQETKDAVLCAARCVEALNDIRSRELAPWDVATLNVAYFEAGRKGSAAGIIPDTASFGGGWRSLDLKVHERFFRRIPEIVTSIAEEMGMKAVMDRLDMGCKPTINDPILLETFLHTVKTTLSDQKIVFMETPNLGGEDAGTFLTEVPGVYFFLQNLAASDDGIVYPHHNPRFTIDESVLYKGTALMAASAVDYLNMTRN